MLIEELSRQSCLDLLSHMRLGRLACAQGTQPYVVPFYFACDNNYIYGFSTVGKKIEWMRANPLVCVEVDEVVSPQDWMSVIVSGRYEELPDTPECTIERAAAFSRLRRRATWWEPAYAKTAIHGRVCSLEPVFYRIHIDTITGRRATHEPSPHSRLWTNSSEDRWPQRILRRLHGEIRLAAVIEATLREVEKFLGAGDCATVIQTIEGKPVHPSSLFISHDAKEERVLNPMADRLFAQGEKGNPCLKTQTV